MPPLPSPGAWLKAQKHRSGRWISLAVGLGVLGGLLLIAQAWFLAKTVNDVIFSDAGLKQVQPWLWAMLGIFALRAVLARASEQAAFRGAMQVKLQLREQLYARIQAIGPVRLGTERSGDLTNSLVDGIEALEAYYARFLPAMSLMALVPLRLQVLDEATASLDRDSERQVTEALARDRTLLTVAHRLATVRNTDRILVLDHGRITEQGRHDELMRANGLYQRMTDMHWGLA